jgi:molybdate transport system permease protein
VSSYATNKSATALPGGRRWLALSAAALLAYCALVGSLFVADAVYIDAKSLVSALRSAEVRSALALSVTSSLVTTALALALAVPGGYFLSRVRSRWTVVADTLIDVSMVMPPLVMGLSVLVLYKVGLDLASSRSPAASVPGGALRAVMDLFIHERAGVVLAQLICSAAYAFRVAKASFDEVDPRYELLARSLGCGSFEAFHRVTLPMARPGLASGAVLTWAHAIGLFAPVQIVAGATRGKTEVLPTGVFLEVSVGRLEAALALALVMAACAAAALVALRLATNRPLLGGGRT